MQALRKGHILPMHAAHVFPAPPRRAFFFDVGASIYNTGAGGASQSWFVETYRRGGVEFDRIFAWEARAPKHSIA